MNLLLESVTCTASSSAGNEMYLVSGYKAPLYSSVKPGCCMNQYSEMATDVTMHAICKPDCKPPPPAPCKTCIEVRVVTNGNGNNPPLDPADCGIVSTWLMGLPQSGCDAVVGNLKFTCTVAPHTEVNGPVIESILQVCAIGEDAEAFVNSWDDQVCSAILAGILGYGSCDVYIKVDAPMCAPEKLWGAACTGPEEVDYPHSCFPGNSNKNGGVGGLTPGQKYTPMAVELDTYDSNSFTFTVKKDQRCLNIVPKEGPPPDSCCDMELDKFEMVLNNQCQGSIGTIEVNGQPGWYPSYTNGSYITTPDVLPEGFPALQSWYKAMKITGGLKRFGNSDLTIKIHLRPPCASPQEFLPGEMLLWFAYFNGPTYGDNCCGTGYAFY